MRKKVILCGVLSLAAILACPAQARAEVGATQAASAPAGAVYVAGNPDCYPIEYYDDESQCYRGVLPELLEDISRASGLEFVYVSAGPQDRRESLAENRQVELVSGCLLERDRFPGTEAGAALFPVTLEGETCQVAFSYTEIATEELCTLIESYIASMPAGEMARRVASFAVENGRQKLPPLVWLGLGAICAGAGLLALWTWLRMRRKIRKDEEARRLDPGTGVWNRQQFLRQFSRSVSEEIRPLCYLFYLHFDIGRVNGYYGEEEAEDLLRRTGDTLRRCTEAPNFFARVSGGGFAVLRQCVTREQAGKWAQKILDELNECGRKFGRDYSPEFHAGIYGLKPGVSCEMALYAADQGCRCAEREGLPYFFCDENLLRSSQETEKLRHDVIRAIENREFQCYLQLVASAETGAAYGAELLSRWHHPDMGFLMPGKFIHTMEESGTITELDFYMFEEACRLLARFELDGWPGLNLFCNFSRKTISLANFSERLMLIAERYCFDRSRLCLEITESCMFESEAAARESLHYCRQAGFRVALDDVGSGYSSFADLANYPIDLAKIDRALLAASEENSFHLLRGMNALFHSINISTLCEGVETSEQCRILRELGIDLIQGFCIQRALPVDETLLWLREREGKVLDC